MGTPLRVGLNGRPFTGGEVRGYVRHGLNLIKTMHEMDPSVEFIFFSDLPIHINHRRDLAFAQTRESSTRPSIFWEQVVLPRLLKKDEVHVFHSFHNVGLPARKSLSCPSVLTVHDLIIHRQLAFKKFKFNSAHFRASVNFWASWWASLSADRIITVSEFTKGELLKQYASLKDRIKVIPNAPDKRFVPGSNAHGPGYFLYVGGFDERKNVEGMLEGFEIYCHRNRQDSGFDVDLLKIVGNDATASDRAHELAQKNSAVQVLGPKNDDELLGLYQNAAAVIVPSFSEGFGFQIVEAMACGVPVLSSNVTSLPEVGGDAVLYFDPQKPEEIAEQMETLAKNSDLRMDLSAKGRERVKKFSWKKSAEMTLNLYRELQLD